MNAFQSIERAARQQGLSFIVIGGLAINFHGLSRETADLDLLVPAEARTHWLEMLTSLGYSVTQERSSFAQFSPPQHGAWPVDLMFVKSETFSPMLAAAREVEMYGVHLKISS